MTYLYTWVRNIIFYLLLISILNQLLPEGSYRKYMKVTAGFVLVLIVFWPVLQLSGSLEQLSDYLDIENMRMSALTEEFQQETVENTQMTGVMKTYYLEIEKEVYAAFDHSLLYPVNVDFQVEEDAGQENYGRLYYLNVDAVTDADQLDMGSDSVNIEVPDIIIENQQDEKQKTETFTEKNQSEEMETEIKSLKTKLAQKLNMSEADIQIVVH